MQQRAPRIVGKRFDEALEIRVTVATCVCCSMISESQIR
jgi:hypothetical protein